MSQPSFPTIALVGPTATGKTALALGLARRLGRAELLNADSRQVLRGLRVGTNQPTAGGLRGVPCHLLGITEPGEPFSVADWVAAARRCLADLDRAITPIVVGGTGLYVKALMDGFELSGGAPDPERRERLRERAASPEGLAELVAELVRRDPQGAGAIDLHNPRRVVRALEVLDAHGSLAARRRPGAARPGWWIGVDAPPELQSRWIAERSRQMLDGGLLQETAAALARGVDARILEGCGIGYREAIGVLAGRMTEAEALAEIVRRTRRYARAQRTWFRAEPRIVWIRRDRDDDLEERVGDALRVLEGSPAGWGEGNQTAPKPA